MPGRNPLLPPLAAALRRRGVELTTWDPTRSLRAPAAGPGGRPLPAQGRPPVGADGRLVPGRRGGADVLNTLEASALVTDKARALARVAAAGVPVPAQRRGG